MLTLCSEHRERFRLTIKQQIMKSMPDGMPNRFCGPAQNRPKPAQDGIDLSTIADITLAYPCHLYDTVTSKHIYHYCKQAIPTVPSLPTGSIPLTPPAFNGTDGPTALARGGHQQLISLSDVVTQKDKNAILYNVV
jgi:hypothetical protein